jgi:hypothetical protein
MKISKTHQDFSEQLNEPKVLTNLEDYLGPNWKDVINFWFYIDTLSENERERIVDSYLDLGEDVRESASDASWCAAEEVVGWKVTSAAWDTYGWATLELIAHHKLLEQGKSLVFLPIFVLKFKDY